MAVNRDFRDLLSELVGASARFLVVGAHAVAFHAVPRYTKDLDIWVEPTEENALRVHGALARFGAPLADLTVADLSSPGVVFQIGVEPNRVDLLTSLSGVSFAEAWDRRQESRYGEVPIAFIGLDDLIRNKKKAGRLQDRLDLEWLEKAKAAGTADAP